MPRERKSRVWVRLDCQGTLNGSINYLFLDEKENDGEVRERQSLACQAIWIKMIAYSEVCGGKPGYIEDNSGRGLPHGYIAQELHCPLELFENVITIMQGDGAIKINGTGSIQLVNFKHYQFSEYDRQKVYRKKEGDGTQTFEEYIEAIRKDYSDLDIDKELSKFKLWWGEGKKELKRPKSAFRNWLDKAREIKNSKNPQTAKTDKYSHMVQK